MLFTAGGVGFTGKRMSARCAVRTSGSGRNPGVRKIKPSVDAKLDRIDDLDAEAGLSYDDDEEDDEEDEAGRCDAPAKRRQLPGFTPWVCLSCL